MDANATQILDEDQNASEQEKNLIGTLHVGTIKHQVVNGLNRIGRAPPCPIVLADATVSRVHAEIHAGSEATFITDLGSVNGTTFKGLTLERFYFYPINDGDAIIFGGVRAIFTKNKELSNNNVENSPRTPVGTGPLRNARESLFSSSKLGSDSTFDDSNGSVIMGSQQNDTNRRLFRRPVMPVNRSINRGRISDIIESPERNEERDKSRNNNDSQDIHNMETQKMLEPATSGSKKKSDTIVTGSSRKITEPEKSPENEDLTVDDVYVIETQNMQEPPLRNKNEVRMSESSKRVEEPEKSSKNVEPSDDIYEMETQNILKPPLRNKNELTVSVSSKKVKEPEKSSINMEPTDDIYEMETQNILKPPLLNKNEPRASVSSKKVKEPEKSSINMEPSDDIYEMETQNILKPPLLNKNEPRASGSSKKVKEPEKSSINMEPPRDIYDMETQNILEPALQNKNETTVSGPSKRVKEPEISLKNVNSRNIHDMKTQDLFNREPLLAPKRPKLERSAELFIDDADDSVYEAETQILVDPEERSKNHEDSNYGNIVEKSASKEPSVIAETDDESRTDDETGGVSRQREDNDLSDESVTDDENQFAALSFNIATKVKSSSKTSTVSSEATNKSKPGANAQNENISRASTTAGNINDDEDLDLVPTQILNVMTSTPMPNRWMIPEEKIDESQVVLDDIDIHDVLTQTVPTSCRNSPDSSTKIPDTNKEKGENKRNKDPNLNDTLDKNMGNIFGQDVTSDGEPMDEPTQLMTQNLVDILKPTQIVTRDTTPPPSVSKNHPDPADGRSPEDIKNETGEILGFVDGRAVGNETKVSCTVTSTSANQSAIRPGNSKEKNTEPANSDLTLPPCSEDDDILFGLPKVRISGTLSNPGSPASSETSDNDLVWPKKWGKSEKVGSPWRSKFSSISTRSKINETRDADSPVLSRKSRVMGKNLSSNRVGEDDDNDSDEDLDYNDLKKIADRLLASGSTNDTNVRKATGFPGLNVEKSLPKKQMKRRPTRKLSETPSSLTVTDPTESDSSQDGNENEVIESSTRGSRKRPRESTRNSRAGKKTMKKESSEESRKVKDVDPNDRLTPVMTHKQFAKVHLTRLSESEFKAKKIDVPQTKITTPKATKLSTSKVAKDSTPSSTTPSRSRARRTVEPNLSLSNQQHKVLFTCVKEEEYEKMVARLGGIVVSDPSKATVLITDKVRRTFKFLCAIAQGIKVVSVNWLVESIDAGHFLDCDNFILQDPEAENKFKFKLAKSLHAARTNKLLSGFTILVTPKVNQPEIHEIKGMVEASGGRVLVRTGGRSWSEKMVIVSRTDDLAAAKTILSKAPKGLKITVQSTEFLLTGILRQEVNLVDHKLL